MPRSCPRDASPLHEEHLARANVDVCPKCRGTWLDGIELKRAVGDAEVVFELARMHGETPDAVLCPACAAPLFLNSLDGIRLDHCRTCLGVWLDAGELDRLAGRSLTSFARSRAERLDLALRDVALALRK